MSPQLPHTLHPTHSPPSTLHPTPYTLHPTLKRSTLNPCRRGARRSAPGWVFLEALLVIQSLGCSQQQPEVNCLPRFSPRLISLEESTLRIYSSGEINLLENLDIVHITLLVDPPRTFAWRASGYGGCALMLGCRQVGASAMHLSGENYFSFV